ncbi:MAG: T9SS type A sorting domain-containing protein, partial [Bacteroidota bacterium]
FEEFTSENCGPCAATNGPLNALLNSNANEVVSIKYQNTIPSPGPLYNHNPTDVGARMTYYSNSYSPNGILDGNVYNDQPASLTQADISNRYAVTSPFTVDITHAINGTDVNVTAVVKMTGSVSTTGLLARFAIIERNIYFTTAPGSNGEKHFEGVMVKMLPDANGTALPSTMVQGDSVVYNFTWTMANVYDQNQIAVVGFVQDDATKEVHQAGYSRTLIQNDAGITANQLTYLNCDSVVAPTVTVYNYGVADINSLDILYKVDAGSYQTFSWTGNIPSGGTAQITLPAITLAVGSHTITTATSNPNASTDQDTHNDSYVTPVLIAAAPIATPIIQGFTTGAFPPAGWARYNPDAGYTWTRVASGAAGTNGSAKIDYYNSVGGQIDELFLPPFSLVGANNAYLTFYVAKARYSAAYNDELDFNATTDCGTTWSQLWGKTDDLGLTTNTTAQTNAWTPVAGSTTDWRLETVDLSSLLGQSDIIAKFTAISGYGNNGYIDDINITQNVGVGENAVNETISIYPIPSAGNVSLTLNNLKATTFTLSVTDLAGKVISRTENVANNGNLSVDLSSYENGSYLISIETPGQKIIKKVILDK